MPIEIVDYDPAWPARFEQARSELLTALPGLFTAIEHVGSTSVPGLAAKPIIDLMAAADDLAKVASHGGELARIGYHFVDAGMPGHLFYPREQDGVRTHHLHVVEAGTLGTRNELLFRDYLRAHPADAARYAELKRRLAATGVTGGDYTRAKTGLVQEVTDKARAARGLPVVPVWEE